MEESNRAARVVSKVQDQVRGTQIHILHTYQVKQCRDSCNNTQATENNKVLFPAAVLECDTGRNEDHNEGNKAKDEGNDPKGSSSLEGSIHILVGEKVALSPACTVRARPIWLSVICFNITRLDSQQTNHYIFAATVRNAKEVATDGCNKAKCHGDEGYQGWNSHERIRAAGTGTRAASNENMMCENFVNITTGENINHYILDLPTVTGHCNKEIYDRKRVG